MAEILRPDLCVLGGSPAGLAAALAAQRLGASVVLLEPGPLGAARPEAVIAAAVLRLAARQAAEARITGAPQATTEWPRVKARIEAAIALAARQDAPRRLDAAGLTLMAVQGRFTDPRTVLAGETLIRARRFLVVPAPQPTLPTLTGLDGVPYLTPGSVVNLKALPAHLLVLGGAPEALALAQAFRRLGPSVTVLVPPDGPLPGFDPELAEIAVRRLRDEGVELRLGVQPVAVERSEGEGVTLRLAPPPDGEVLAGSHLLVAIGTGPLLAPFELDKARLRPDPARPGRPGLRHGRTSNRRIFVLDGGADSQFDHAALVAGRDAVDRALLGMPPRRLPRAPVRLAATDPQIAEAGLTEAAAAAGRKPRYRVVRAPFGENDRAIAEGTPHGLAKLVVDLRGRLLGVSIVGPEAAELSALFALALSAGLTVRQLGEFVPPHPTFAAIAGALAAEWERDEKPDPGRLRRFCFTRWRR